ncbi:PilN domain-containing protein [Halarsenatibacter silvermanii]|uniref:Tfp pilus assembly protein PilN n=1 Tax=Halarsenatibacter silvermanii TaxID=321763 RepID=A0A1G9LBW6_9FIRM|nr:PilN domain-containing protein [Halarsenatibacter silvermanii]SDL59458.1 hypothetical protein SAMN04488692_10619 [Halarsenatibacter silvermanii]
MRVNLFDEKKVRRKIRWSRILTAVLVIAFVITPAAHFYSNHQELASLRNRSQSLAVQLDTLRVEEETYFELREEISEFEMPEEIIISRYRLRGPMQEFGEIMPEELTLTRMDYSDGDMMLEGFASEIEMILELAENIHKSEILGLESLSHFRRGDYVEFTMALHFDTREELSR